MKMKFTKIKGHSKINTTAFVRMKLASSPEWAKRACIVLSGQQTSMEKRLHISSGHNDVGFNRHDAPLLSYLAGRIRSSRITLVELETLQKVIPKYCCQIISLSKPEILKQHLDAYYSRKDAKLPM